MHYPTRGRYVKAVLRLIIAASLVVLPCVHGFADPPALYSQGGTFSSGSHIVSVSVFHWFTSTGGQLSGPWRPIEGRANWTGETDWWKSQIKQMMSANIDALWVHLIPSNETQRINLFRALNQMRSEGYDVPKVAPFLDPMITWNGQPLVDVATTAGKDTFVNQYIRFFQQYYSVNQDQYADSYLEQIDGRVVLDTWHVLLNLANLSSLTRSDVETRLATAFGASHPVFNTGIRMVTTALNPPTLSFADEKVTQFEYTAYSSNFSYNNIGTVQLKGGYWDKNIRNPGSILQRNGGANYKSAWNGVDRNTIKRAYIESWNEYDEGSGIYAADPGPPYIKPGSGNTSTDTWSSTGDSREYIKTTASGASAFNDTPDLDSRILWHSIPAVMGAGRSVTAQIVVRNQGDVSWKGSDGVKLGQNELTDPVLFGASRYPIDDAKDEISTYGGIFRGRPITFTVQLVAPSTPGVYTTHWQMMRGNAWFGPVLSATVNVVPVVPVTVSVSSPSVAATKGGPVTYTVTYANADAITLSAADIQVQRTGTATGIIGISGSGNTRTVTISGIIGNGTLGGYIAPGTASNTWGVAGAVGPCQTFIVDNTAPVGSVTANGGAQYTNSTSVPLALTGSDPSGVSRMCFRNSTSDPWSAWEPFATSKTWTLAPGDGLKRVDAMIEDGVGNTTTPFDLITLDSTAPVLSGSPADAGTYTGNTSLVFNWPAASDTGSGIAGYNCCIGTSPGGSDVMNGILGNVLSASIVGSYGKVYYCKVQARDNTGNTSAWSANSDGIVVVQHSGIDISAAKELADQASVGLSLKSVSAIFADCFYVQGTDRVSGIRICPAVMPSGLSIGSLVDIGGTLRVSSSGERYIDGVAATR